MEAPGIFINHLSNTETVMKTVNDTLYPVPQKQGNIKMGVTIRLNREEEAEPFEVTVFLKKPEQEPARDHAISITTAGKVTLHIGGKGSMELFGENTRILRELEEGRVPENVEPGEETDDEMPVL
jgi:hypothetical protein